MPVTVSLVIPSYNRASLVAQTIDSALAQHKAFHEIIVVDDGSTDDTARVLAGFGDRIKMVSLPNGGVQVARNTGVALATGEYIALCDSDDLLAPDFVATAADWFGRHPEFQAFYSNFVTFNDLGIFPDKFSSAPQGFFDGARVEGDFLYDIPDLYVRTMVYQPLFVSGCIFSKALYQRLGGFDLAFHDVGAEDWEFTLRVLEAGRTVLCKRPLVHIRKHASNESGDSMRQVRGAAYILEYALNRHMIAAGYRDIILGHIRDRRVGVFHVAFGRGDFVTAQEMLNLLNERPAELKFMCKAVMTRLPAPLRHIAWTILQSVRPAGPASIRKPVHVA
ncbi:glycosyltransferase [Massilia sp.]|uniref:glycosyltransferase n=1 Tax=Massilia sp. TaxID=1882437 RepID=UPI003919BF7B